MENLASYAGPGALLTLLAIWLYVGVKKGKFSVIEYMVYFPALLKQYKDITIKENGRVGILYYLFIVLVVLAFLSVFSSVA